MNTLENIPPAVIVRNLAEARAVAEAARRLGRPVTLLTEPGAQAWLGPAYLLEMARQAGADGESVVAVIDCGEDAGFAMLALRVGWRALCLAGEAETVRRVAEMAEAVGGRLHERPPEALGPGAGAEALAAWLGAPAAD